MNKTFIEDNNDNIRIHFSNNEYYYQKLNNNILIPGDYLKLYKVENYNDIINTLSITINSNFTYTIINNDEINNILVDNKYIETLTETPNDLCLQFNSDTLISALNSLNHL